MFAILYKTESLKKGNRLFKHFYNPKIKLTFHNLDRTKSIPLPSSELTYIFDIGSALRSETMVSLKLRKMELHETLKNLIIFEFPKITVKLHFRFDQKTFDALDSQIDQELLEYKKQRLFEDKEFQTVLLKKRRNNLQYFKKVILKKCIQGDSLNVFEKKIPEPNSVNYIELDEAKEIVNREIKYTQDGKLLDHLNLEHSFDDESVFYLDIINKTVSGIHPEIMQASLRNRIKYLFDTIESPGKCTRINIDRNNLINSTIENLLPIILDYDIRNCAIKFENEIGEDHGAILREYILFLFKDILVSGILISKNGIYDAIENFSFDFIYDYDISKLDISLLRDILQDILALNNRSCLILLILGVVIGAFLILNETFDINFSLSFYENLAKKVFTIRHIQDIELQKNLLKSSEFTNDDELQEYLNELLFNKKRNCYDFIRFGFDLVVKKKLDFQAFDFPFVFFNFIPIAVCDIKKRVCYENCDQRTIEIQWLWEILEHKESDFICAFLMFFTGCASLGMFENNVYLIFEKVSSKNHLFTASSCIKKLYVPTFDSKRPMEYYLEYSINNTRGFHKI